MLYNSDLRHGLEFDCNYQALLDRGVKPFIDFNAFRHLCFSDFVFKIRLIRLDFLSKNEKSCI